jgi:hypothetical protein
MGRQDESRSGSDNALFPTADIAALVRRWRCHPRKLFLRVGRGEG